jgi:hypothetical protein
MPDEQPQPTPIALTQALVFIMEQTWPQVTRFTDEFLRITAPTRGATYDEQAGTVTFDIFNGGAVYQLDPAETGPTGAPLPRLGTLVDGSARKTTRRP